MYIPLVDITTLFGIQFSGIFDMPPHFSLAVATGVACLLGGSNAISTMITVHVYKDRCWLGWYNVPGSFYIAQQLSSLARSASISTNVVNLFFGLDSCKGPGFRGVESGTVIEDTGSVAELFLQECAALEVTENGEIGNERRTSPIGITIARLNETPDNEIPLTEHSGASTIIFAIISIVVNIAACVVCAIFQDWMALLSISTGILVNGASSIIFSHTGLAFTHPNPARDAPRGDGILGSGMDMVVLIGEEGAVNSITRGKISFHHTSDEHPVQFARMCSVFFFIQFIIQLFLIPQASLFGQTMFLVSLGVPALYQYWLSQMSNGKVHRKILLEKVLGDQAPVKFTCTTYTTAVALISFVMKPSDFALLNHLLPNNTDVWKKWKTAILGRLHSLGDHPFQPTDEDARSNDSTLLRRLYQDAEAARTACLNNPALQNTRTQ